MRVRKYRTLAISASLLFFAAACSSGDKNEVELTTPWLGALHGFERSSGQDGFGVFLRNSTNATERFTRGIIDPPEIIVSASSDLDSISPASYEKIKTLFSEIFRRELAGKIPAANTAEERESASHVIHTALTNITVTRKTNNPAAAKIGDLQFSFEDSRIEAEIRSRKTNARVAVIIVPVKAAMTGWDSLRTPFVGFAGQAAAEAAKARSAIDTKAAQPSPAEKKPAQAPAK